MIKTIHYSVLSFFAVLLCAGTAHAEWKLDNDASHLSYVSMKNSSVAEPNYFRNLSGSVLDDGKAVVEISMGSVETNIDIRNERVKKHLFNISEFPVATITSQLDMSQFKNVAMGQSLNAEITIHVSMVGVDNDYDVEATIYRVSNNAVLVTSRNQIIVDADDYDLTGGLETLRNIAKLNSIETVVPVSFALMFKQ